MPSPIRVLCVDDHDVVHQGIGAILGQQPDIEVVAYAGSVTQAIVQFRAHKPDVTLMDVQLGALSGIEAIRAIRAKDQDARIIVLTIHHGDEDMNSALEAGACAYLLKETLADDLVHVIREVHAGTHPAPMPQSDRHRAALTSRERDVIELLAKGMRNKEIAWTLGIAEDTVQVHVKSIFAKFDVHDRTAALVVAARRGIIRLQ